MNMRTIQKIPLNEIDSEDETFSINFMPDLQRLRSSVEEIGFIQPILLKKRSNRYQIVSGFRRVTVARELGKSEMESRVCEEKEMDEFRLFSLCLHENVNTRGFNAVEKAIALDKLIDRFQIEPPVVISTFLPLLALEPYEKILNTYLSLARMEDELKEYVLRQEVSRYNIRKLSALIPDDRMAFLCLASPLKLGENRLREFLTLVEEISRRDRCNVRDIVSRAEVQEVLSQEELTPSQKTDHMKKVLMSFRYPKLHRLEEEFEKKRKDLNLPPKVVLHHSAFFEGKGLRIEFQFETMEAYRRIVSSLAELGDEEEFEELIQGF